VPFTVRWSIVVRSVIAALLAAASVCLGASTASAGLEGEDVSLTLDPASVNVDSLFSAVLVGCVDGQNVTFTLVPGDSKTSPCIGADGDGSVGSANAEFLSPDDPGTYTVTGEVLETAATATAQLTVVIGEARTPRFVDITRLTGTAEVPGPGDPNGRGSAVIRVDSATGAICYRLRVHRIEPASMAHIHIGGTTDPGPVVQDLAAPTDGSSSGCVVNAALADAIVAHPSNYYVNVHNAPFPAGAVRGQLG
jgi:CHRD domain